MKVMYMSKKVLSIVQQRKLKIAVVGKSGIDDVQIKAIKLDPKNFSDIVMSSVDCETLAFDEITARVLEIILKNPMTNSKKIFLTIHKKLEDLDIKDGWQEITAQDIGKWNNKAFCKLKIT